MPPCRLSCSDHCGAAAGQPNAARPSSYRCSTQPIAFRSGAAAARPPARSPSLCGNDAGSTAEPTRGVEPRTPRLRSECSGHLSYVGGTSASYSERVCRRHTNLLARGVLHQQETVRALSQAADSCGWLPSAQRTFANCTNIGTRLQRIAGGVCRRLLSCAIHRDTGAPSVSGTTDLTARKGVEAVRSLLVDLGCYPREPSDPDQGIDLLVETAVDGIVDGRMLAMQIKSGASQVSEQDGAHAVHRCSDRHVKQRLLQHSLPVLVVLYDPNEKLAYWQVVSDETVLSTGQGWKIRRPLRSDARPSERGGPARPCQGLAPGARGLGGSARAWASCTARKRRAALLRGPRVACQRAAEGSRASTRTLR